MGSAVDKENLSAEMDKYADKGIGGVEITPIYGARGFEDKYISYLSPKWMDMLGFTINKADSLGMGVDMNTGTGWPFGGPQISLQHAASRLIIQKYDLKGGEMLKERIAIQNPKDSLGAVLQALTGYNDKGETLDLMSFVDKTGQLKWKAKKGNWTLYAAFAGKTLQVVKRSAPGGEGYTFDHFSKDALNKYLSRFDSAFSGKNYHVRNFFNDSYEVFGASWSPVFFDEFKLRRGYDLKNHLRELNGEGDSLIVARIKSDYRQTMGDLVHDHFTVGWTNWAHAHQAGTKNQSHGSPANLLDLYATVDIPEIETFGAGEFPIPGFRRDSADVKYSDTDPLFQKFASSGAHISGRNLVSCETFTWLRDHFKGSMAHMKPELDQLFVSGVNHVFYHGTTYSPKEAGWPGWLFYASVHFGPTNSIWDQLDGLNDYVTRCQSVLQSGSHDNDILVYWPVYDIWNDANGMVKQFTVHNAHTWLFMQPVRDIMAKGYSFDFVSDKQIEELRLNGKGLITHANVQPYQTLIVPALEFMPIETFQKLIDLAQGGANVIFEKLPSNVPGYHNYEQRQKALKSMIETLKFSSNGDVSIASVGAGQIMVSSDFDKALVKLNVKRETLNDTGLKFARRKLADGYYYFISNNTANTIDQFIPLCRKASNVIMMDPLSGNYGVAEYRNASGQFEVRVQLKSGESCFLRLSDSSIAASKLWNYEGEQLSGLTINTPWKLEFIKGGSVLPKSVVMDSITYWTNLGNDEMNQFSGTAAYSTVFEMPKQLSADYLLKIEQVRESARVFINEQEIGVMWTLPSTLKVGQYLKPGKNSIRIEVANLMANRIRVMDQQKVEWRVFREINFVNIGYKPFDASRWDIQPSGIGSPVVLVPLK